MFKKVLALILCLMFALTAVACSGDKSADATDGDASSNASESKPMFEGDTNQQIEGYIAYAKLVESEPKDSGRTCEIIARDNTLVYVYKYQMSFTDNATTFGSINNGLDAKKATYDKLHSEIKALVPTVEAVIIELYTKEGELALSKKYVNGSDVVTGGAYAPASESQSGMYGKWVSAYEVSGAVLSLLQEEYPDANVSVSNVTVDYIMEFYEDGKCVVAMDSGDGFYNALLKAAEDYLKTVKSGESAVKTALDEYKAKYTKDIIDAQLNMSEQGNFVLTGDPNTTGTITLSGDQMEGNMKFIVSGNKMDLIPLGSDGSEFTDSKLTFTRK